MSLAEGAIRVAKGKRSKEEAARETAVNTAKAGAVAGVMAVALTGVVALGAGPALSAFSRVVVPLGVAMYGWSAFRRIKGALEDPAPPGRVRRSTSTLIARSAGATTTATMRSQRR